MKLGLIFSAPVQTRLISLALLYGIDPATYEQLTAVEWAAIRRRRRAS
jgi:hypothetical protein